MTEPEHALESLRRFEGMWLMTKPSGAVACVGIVRNRLLIPYSMGNEGKLSGHYYDLRAVGGTLFGRFEQFDSAVRGVFFLAIGPNETLSGGRWTDREVPAAVQKDPLRLSESLPGMQKTVWIRMRGTGMPEWAERYFREEWPNKPF